MFEPIKVRCMSVWNQIKWFHTGSITVRFDRTCPILQISPRKNGTTALHDILLWRFAPLDEKRNRDTTIRFLSANQLIKYACGINASSEWRLNETEQF